MSILDVVSSAQSWTGEARQMFNLPALTVRNVATAVKPAGTPTAATPTGINQGQTTILADGSVHTPLTPQNAVATTAAAEGIPWVPILGIGAVIAAAVYFLRKR